jgi:hypothetical protein
LTLKGSDDPLLPALRVKTHRMTAGQDEKICTMVHLYDLIFFRRSVIPALSPHHQKFRVFENPSLAISHDHEGQ